MYRGNGTSSSKFVIDMPRRVSFDFDHTLDKLDVQHLAYNLIQLGIEVWVCTARHSNENKLVDSWGNEDLFLVTDRLGIPRDRIIFCNYEDKRPFIEAERFEWHLDDDFMVINSLRDSFVPGIHVLQKGWMDKCIKILNLYEMNNLDHAERMRIVSDSHAGFESIDSAIVNSHFNIVEVRVVVKEKATGKYFASNFFQDIEVDNNRRDWSEINVPEAPIFREVFPKSVTTIIYE